MKSLAQQMSVYQDYHRNARNKATHFVGVPAIVIAIMLVLSWVPVGLHSLTLADVLVLPVLAYYFALDVPLALATTIAFGMLLGIAHQLDAVLSASQGWTAFAVLFVGGWIAQLIGHYFEGRKPALVDNLFQIVIAPIFLMAEVFFALGYKPALRHAVERGATGHTAR
jgi:uncharacterized membrane protein YGL010W